MIAILCYSAGWIGLVVMIFYGWRRWHDYVGPRCPHCDSRSIRERGDLGECGHCGFIWRASHRFGAHGNGDL